MDVHFKKETTKHKKKKKKQTPHTHILLLIRCVEARQIDSNEQSHKSMFHFLHIYVQPQTLIISDE